MIRILTPEQEVALIEKLAELEHEQWMQWSQAIASRENISSEIFKRWQLLWKEYDELTEEEKEQDRIWARKVLALLTEFNIPSPITEQQTMGINGKEAVAILSALWDEDGEITETEQNLEKRIRKQFPAIGDALKKRERETRLWEHEVEDDKMVREVREKLEKFHEEREKKYDVILNEFMALKRKVLHELLEKEATK